MAKIINEKHPDYADFIQAWETMRDCMSGEDTIKEHGERYLPMKSGILAMSSKANRDKAYLNYMSRAEFPELLSPTVRGSVGLVCEKEPEITLPSQLEYLRENCDGAGTTLSQFFQKIVGEILEVGRYGILPGISRKNASQFSLTGYKAEQIINWDTDDDGATNYVVLDESRLVRNPESNARLKEERYLELILDEETGAYTATRWRAGAIDEEMPVASRPDRSLVDAIPFVFVNTGGLEPKPDDIPLYGLAKLALRIYRLDADYTNGLHLTSEPTPYVTGFDDAANAIKEGHVPKTLGASSLWVLPPSATAGFLEFSGPGLEAQSKAIASALERAVMFGAQTLSENSQASESGKARGMRLRGQRSLMVAAAMVAGQALERALRSVADWSSLRKEDVTVKPNVDFEDHILDSAMLREMVAGWQSGGYSKRTLFENLRRASFVPSERSFEDEEELISTEGDPLGGIGRTSNSDGTTA